MGINGEGTQGRSNHRAQWRSGDGNQSYLLWSGKSNQKENEGKACKDLDGVVSKIKLSRNYKNLPLLALLMSRFPKKKNYRVLTETSETSETH